MMGCAMTDREMSDEEYLEALKEAEANRQWIREHYKELARKYPDEYICVKNGSVVNSGRDAEALSKLLGDELDMVCEYILPYGTAMLL